MTAYLLILVVSYLIGTFPTAYLLVRRTQHVDLREAGSTNIGALNAYEVTGAKWIGLAVMLIDMLKGALAVLIAPWIAAQMGAPPDQLFWYRALGLIGVVAGHNYNLWLSLDARRVVGGKGFAAAAGALLLFMPALVIAWIATHYLTRFIIARLKGINDVIIGNVFATLLFPVYAWLLYGPEAGWIGLILALLILPKHVHQFQALWQA